jgi:hypothetical protein
MVRLPDESPILQRLAALPDGDLIAGRLLNLPVIVGRTTAFPTLGITPPPPNYLLESATRPPAENTEAERRRQRRLGVTYGVWGSHDDVRGTEIIAETADPAIDRLLEYNASSQGRGVGPWKLVRVPDPFPSAWIATHVQEARNWGQLYAELARADADADTEAWFLREDVSSPLPRPLGHVASIKQWNGRTTIVEHDGACILIVRRPVYPGWVYRINQGPEQPVIKVNGGLQGVLLTGSGTSEVTLSYRPTGLKTAMVISCVAATAAIAVCGLALWPYRQRRNGGVYGKIAAKAIIVRRIRLLVWIWVPEVGK